MLVQKGSSKKRTSVLAAVAIVLLLATAGVVYYVFFTEPDVDTVSADVRPVPTIQTTFPVSILENEKLKALKLYGPAEVTVSERGRKANPFEAF